jgi:hypothetical protein
MRDDRPRCIAGITLFSAMFAAPSTPQRTGDAVVISV